MTTENIKLPTREQYFAAALPLLQRHVFTPAGLTLPANVRIGVGTLSNRKAGARHTLGVCFPVAASSDSTIEITTGHVRIPLFNTNRNKSDKTLRTINIKVEQLRTYPIVHSTRNEIHKI